MTGKYSIWLVPKGAAYGKLSGLISRIAEEYGTPKFVPHVSLIADIVGEENEVVSKTEKLSSEIKPFNIKLTEADYSDGYFKSLFIKGEKSKELLEANLKAREIFDKGATGEYSLHLSLMYSSNIASAVKEKIILKIGREFNISFEAQTISLYIAEEGTDGWRKVGEFKLG